MERSRIRWSGVGILLVVGVGIRWREEPDGIRALSTVWDGIACAGMGYDVTVQ